MKKLFQSISYCLLYGSYYLLSLLPLRVLYCFSDCFYFLTYYIARYRRGVVRQNLTHSFPEKDIAEIIAIEKAFYSNLCDYFFEALKLMSMSKKEMRKRMKYEGMEQIGKLLDEGRSIAFYLSHTFNWEWISSFPMHVKIDNDKVVYGQIYHRLANEAFDRLFLRLRERFGATSIPMPDTARAMMGYRRDKRPFIIGFIADQAPKWYMLGHWLTFLNQDTAVITGTERIVKKMGCAAIFCTVSKVKRGYYVCQMGNLIEDTSKMADYELTDLYYTYLEKSIRTHPDLWLWSHKRWKWTREKAEQVKQEQEAAKRKRIKNGVNKEKMTLSIIVAAAENNIIGGDNKLLWHLPNDMKWFKGITTGSTVIMGRKTYQSIGRPLPNRRNIVVSRNVELQLEGCEVAHSIEDALLLTANDHNVFVMGGGEIYQQVWDKAEKIYLTRVHTDKEGDTVIPAICPEEWAEESRDSHPADEKHPYGYTFLIYNRKH